MGLQFRQWLASRNVHAAELECFTHMFNAFYPINGCRDEEFREKIFKFFDVMERST